MGRFIEPHIPPPPRWLLWWAGMTGKASCQFLPPAPLSTWQVSSYPLASEANTPPQLFPFQFSWAHQGLSSHPVPIFDLMTLTFWLIAMQGKDEMCLWERAWPQRWKWMQWPFGAGGSNHPLGFKTFRLDLKDENNKALYPYKSQEKGIPIWVSSRNKVWYYLSSVW